MYHGRSSCLGPPAFILASILTRRDAGFKTWVYPKDTVALRRYKMRIPAIPRPPRPDPHMCHKPHDVPLWQMPRLLSNSAAAVARLLVCSHVQRLRGNIGHCPYKHREHVRDGFLATSIRLVGCGSHGRAGHEESSGSSRVSVGTGAPFLLRQQAQHAQQHNLDRQPRIVVV